MMDLVCWACIRCRVGIGVPFEQSPQEERCLEHELRKGSMKVYNLYLERRVAHI